MTQTCIMNLDESGMLLLNLGHWSTGVSLTITQHANGWTWPHVPGRAYSSVRQSSSVLRICVYKQGCRESLETRPFESHQKKMDHYLRLEPTPQRSRRYQ